MSRALHDWEETIAALALAVVFLAVTWGVIARYLSPQPATWSGEVASLGFAWVVFLGAAAGARRRLHVGVDVVTARLPAAVQRVIAGLVSLLLAGVLGYMAWLAGVLGWQSMNRPTPVLRLPASIVHVAVIMGFGSMAVGAALEGLRTVRRLLQ